MSSVESSWAIGQAAGGALPKLILMLMGDACDVDACYRGSIAYLAGAAECTDAEAREAIASLAARGLVRRRQDPLGGVWVVDLLIS